MIIYGYISGSQDIRLCGGTYPQATHTQRVVRGLNAFNDQEWDTGYNVSSCCD